MIDSTSIDDAIFEAPVRKVAKTNYDIYTKLIEGAQAQTALAIREREEMAADLATTKQKLAALRLLIDIAAMRIKAAAIAAAEEPAP